jgi:putative flippase GtrA
MNASSYDSRDNRLDLVRQVITFLCVGGFATALHYAVMFALVYTLGWHPVPASTTGFLTSAVVNFALNARFTFRSTRSVLHTAPRFAIVAASGLLLNRYTLALLLSLGTHVLIGQIVATLCVLTWNYIINAIWTFKAKKS